MQERFLYLIATFDEETSRQMKDLENKINEAGIVGRQTPGLPHHITLACFDTSYEEEVKEMLREVCSKTYSFELSFNHIGLFGLDVLFLAPNVNHELLQLRKSFDTGFEKSSQEWTPHATILIDQTENIQRALPLVAQSFKPLKGTVESISLYEFFPSRFIARYDLQEEKQ